MENITLLTKSDLLLFLDAPRHLWAAKHDLIDQTPSVFNINVMRQGYEVEALAKEYIEKFVLKLEEKLIFQKTFTDRQFTVRTDILIHKPATDSYDLYEVKSGTSVKKENIFDVTYQFLIVNKHIMIDRVFILHLNSEYIRYSNLNLAELFIAEDVTQKVLKLKDDIDKLRELALETMVKSSKEDTQPCLNPKCCPCPDICYPGLLEFSIFDIPRLSKKKKMELLNQGVLDIKEVPKSFPLNQKQRQIVDVAQTNQEFINREAIQKEFQHFTYPLFFLDYETYLSAIPMYDGYKPQQQMVFQYSLHKIESLHGDIRHTEHLAITKDDPPARAFFCPSVLPSRQGPTGTRLPGPPLLSSAGLGSAAQYRKTSKPLGQTRSHKPPQALPLKSSWIQVPHNHFSSTCLITAGSKAILFPSTIFFITAICGHKDQFTVLPQRNR